jgi:DNA-directed RNA polymerase subunit RPC12/RpoP
VSTAGWNTARRKVEKARRNSDMKLYDITDWCKHGVEVEDYPYIGEVDIKADTYEFGTPLNINGTHYTIGVFSKAKDSAGARKTEINYAGKERSYENNIVCPYCGYENRDSWECADSDDEYECGRCQGIFSYERVVTVEYNSFPVKPPEVVSGNWIKAAR